MWRCVPALAITVRRVGAGGPGCHGSLGVMASTLLAAGVVTSARMADGGLRLERLVRLLERLLREHPFLRENPPLPPDDLCSHRALVSFQDICSDVLAHLKPLQAGIVVAELRRHSGDDSDDVTQDAQLKLTRKLRQATEWDLDARAVAVRCTRDAVIEFRRRKGRQPQVTQHVPDAPSSTAYAEGTETAWDQTPCAMRTAMALALSAGASRRDARLWVSLEVVDRSGAAMTQLAERHCMRPNAVYQATHRVRRKVCSHLQRTLCLSLQESAVLENDMRARDRRSDADLAEELDRTVVEIRRMRRALRARLADYVNAMEER